MPARKAVNLTMDAELLARARAEGLNLSALLEDHLRAEIAKREAQRWKRENADALSANAAYIEANGLPLAGLRQF
jgi:antitoxin CcdA